MHHVERLCHWAPSPFTSSWKSPPSRRPSWSGPPDGPLSVSPPKACRQPPRTQSFEWVPVCVLGPLTTPDKTELQNAVTTYLDEPLEDIW